MIDKSKYGEVFNINKLVVGNFYVDNVLVKDKHMYKCDSCEKFTLSLVHSYELNKNICGSCHKNRNKEILGSQEENTSQTIGILDKLGYTKKEMKNVLGEIYGK